MKEENNKLKEIAGRVHEVERLKQENQVMKQELLKLKAPNKTDGFKLEWS